MIPIDIFNFGSKLSLLLFLSRLLDTARLSGGQTLTCFETVNTTCDIGPSEDGWCSLYCENRSIVSTCFGQCHHTIFGCKNDTESVGHFSFCCNQSYCNNSTEILSRLIQTPSPTAIVNSTEILSPPTQTPSPTAIVNSTEILSPPTQTPSPTGGQTLTCFETVNTTCDIGPSEDGWCSLYCENRSIVSTCFGQCHHTIFVCENDTESVGHFSFCCNQSYCNDFTEILSQLIQTPSPTAIVNSTEILSPPTQTPSPTAIVKDNEEEDNKSKDNQHHIIIAICVVVVVLVATVIAGLAVFQWLRSKRRMLKLPLPNDSWDSSNMHDITDDSMAETMTSGSGSGMPRMVDRTIAKQIELQEVIGSGRYGQVYLGDYRDEHVAVKIFSTVDEESWNREKDIYSIVLIRNDYILGYIAADMISNNGVTELWLITQYHPLGSLYDFLSVSDVKLTPSRMILFALSICNGLYHLHTEFSGVQGKPSIAHRDLKSKNILVKTNNTCCIADFGLAVYRDVQTRKINLPPTYKNGTVRYLPPEILNNTIDLNIFDSFLYVDMYCLALVFWEIGLRTGTDEVDEYQVPYYNMVPHDPTFEEMKKVVGVDGKRPVIPQRWANCEVLRAVKELICECWFQDSNARLPAARVKKGLKKIAQDLKIDQI